MDYTHDHMVLTIKELYPGAVHGKDFLVMHPVDENGQCGDPFIAVWKRPEPQPSNDDVKAHFVANHDALAAKYVRWQRDSMLRFSDKKAVVPPDAPATVAQAAAAWQTYRKALRDVPQQEGFPHNVEWPVAPK